MVKEKIYKNVIANICIVVMLLTITFVAFNSQVNVMLTSGAIKAYYSGDVTSKNISLMINVYWGTEYLPSLLDNLREKEVTATFFIGGIWAEDNQEFWSAEHGDRPCSMAGRNGICHDVCK